MPDANLLEPQTAAALKRSFDQVVIKTIHTYQKNNKWIGLTTRVTMNSIYEKQGGNISQSKLQTIAKAAIGPAAEKVVGSLGAVKDLGKMYDISGLHAASPVLSAVSSLGGFTSAVGPWIAFNDIRSAYWPDINKNNLHDIVEDANSRNQQYACSCPEGEDGKTECDDSIEWLINRVEGKVVMKAVSVFLGGVPGLMQTAYSKVREGVQHLRFQSSSSQKELYPSPSPASVWKPDADRCSYCLTELASLVASYIIGSASRHHCRVCGYNYCEKCCFYKVAVLNPLTKGGREEGVKEHCLVCTRCILSAKAQRQSLSNYATGPLRHAEILKRNATPKSVADNGCRRAQAALFAIYHGRVDEVLVVLIARDGGQHIVSMLEI